MIVKVLYIYKLLFIWQCYYVLGWIPMQIHRLNILDQMKIF